MNKYNLKRGLIVLSILLTVISIVFIVYLEIGYKKCEDIILKKLYTHYGSVNCSYLSDMVRENNPAVSTYSGYQNIYEVDRDLIAGSNGLACSSKYGYIARDLPRFSKKYVAYHEYLHTQGLHNETEVNYKAGLKEPLGLFETSFYSARRSILNSKLNQCTLPYTWKVFKVYFLNDNF